MAGPTLDPLAQEIMELVVGLMQRMRLHFAEATADLGLSTTEGRALFFLEEPRPMGELAGTLRCDASYVTGISNRLEELGLVQRQVDANDRRVKNLVLTPEGKRLREAIRLRTQEDLPATAGLTVEQRRQLRDLLRTVIESGVASGEVSEFDPSC